AARVEAAAAETLAARGGDVWHLENALPLGLFGLAYWDWVFAPVDGAFVNAFQNAPIDLFWPDFFATRRGLCDDPLALDDASLRAAMLDTAESRRGIANRLVDWRALDAQTLDRVLAGIPMADVRRLLAIVAEDLDRARSGFPDLTAVYEDGSYEFAEVKGPTDQLRRHQRLWIDRLRAADLPVRVLRFR
ncbi:MAG: VRR-NUC domain-containing protein, partial [Gammaproteobacteria bacterium]|nr:VRR-NUC domain-containing protein [Gammaproteobacteria bacterium]